MSTADGSSFTKNPQNSASSPSLTPPFVEVNETNIKRYAEVIETSLKESSAVGFTLHSTTPPRTLCWVPGETTQAYYTRNVAAALSHEVWSVGITCARFVEKDDPVNLTPSVSVITKNFNVTTSCLASSFINREELLSLAELGYDLNYVAAKGTIYYRGREDLFQHADDSQVLRKIFLNIHGTGSHAVVLDGFSEIIMGYTSFCGLPGDSASDFLLRIYTLFPGKIFDVEFLKAGLGAVPSLTAKCLFEYDFPMDKTVATGLDESVPEKMENNFLPNTKHPAVFDSFRNVDSFVNFLANLGYLNQAAKDKNFESCDNLVAISNVVSCGGSSSRVKIVPEGESRFSSKRKKAKVDWTIPPSDVNPMTFTHPKE